MARARGAASEIGVLSDTHGLLRPAALRALAGVAHIVHAGDIGKLEVLDALARVAPVTAVRGNNDRGVWAEHIPERAVLDAARVRILVLHDRHELDIDPRAAGFAVVVSGHSHRPAIEEVSGVLYVNPGSAGPRRFRLPIALARLAVDGKGGVTAKIVELPADS